MSETILYVHGRGGSAEEASHYKPLFPGCAVFGADYQTSTPWEAGAEIHAAAESLRSVSGDLILIANSIGAYFSMHASLGGLVRQAFFISPVVDMGSLIAGRMAQANVTEEELEKRGTIPTPFGEPLSWEYLSFVRSHPIEWNVPTHILYGVRDFLTPPETIRAFAQTHGASLTVMENGEHWFHTKEQMQFLDDWIRRERNQK
jgi:hypothetical protein